MPFDRPPPTPAPRRTAPARPIVRLRAALARLDWPGARRRRARVAVWRLVQALRRSASDGPGG